MQLALQQATTKQRHSIVRQLEMTANVPTPPTPAASRIPLILTLVAAVFASGFFFHTSFDPVVFGKYNARYTLYVCAIFFVLVPAFYVAVRFLCSASVLVGSRGRQIIVRPRQKLTAAAILGLVGFIAGNFVLHQLLARTVGTHDAHMFHPY